MRLFLTIFMVSLLFFKAQAQEPSLACRELTQMQIAIDHSLSSSDAEEFERTKNHYCNLDNSDGRIGMTLLYSTGQIAVDMLGVEGATWYLPNGDPLDLELSNSLFFNRKVAPIEAPFKKYHAKCSGGCSYISWGIWGDEAHKKKASCHNSGQAIDIHAVVCGKTTSKPNTTKFQNYLKCMRNYFGVIHGNAAHKNHAHIQLKNCKKIKLK